ncbi:hypothetical protein GLYMA_13G264832v4 [Glycine max]|nr:hypothetical protein GLYMA_13G264832v4 [Glycine max]KAH1103519.1 hypothetical protein GYH30_037460 [Glycine max]
MRGGKAKGNHIVAIWRIPLLFPLKASSTIHN